MNLRGRARGRQVTTMRELLVLSLAVLALVGCDKGEVAKARKTAKEAAAKLSQEYEESKVLAQARELLAAVDSCDLDGLKQLCVDQVDGDYKVIMSCYYNAFVIENDQGVEPARKYLADEMKAEGVSPVKAKALGALNTYFTEKGSLRTREVAGLVLIIALEAKFPHRGAALGGIVAEKLGLLSLPRSATQPASSATQPARARNP